MIITEFCVRLKDPCGRLACGPGWCRTRENSLRLDDAELWLVWKGRGWMRTRDQKLDLLPGFCALMRPGGIYDADQDETNPLGITYIHFDAWKGPAFRRNQAGQLYSHWPEFFEVPDLEFYDAALRRTVQLFPRQKKMADDLLRAVLLDLLRSAPNRTTRSIEVPAVQRKKIAQLVVSVHSESTHLPRVSDMARSQHWSPAHFGRVFKLVTQQSPRDFLLQIRLSRARHLLSETSLSVGEIAERLGYADVFFFSRQFKAKMGLSPLRYRSRQSAATV